jgi:hypothetical protein
VKTGIRHSLNSENIICELALQRIGFAVGSVGALLEYLKVWHEALSEWKTTVFWDIAL